MTEEPLIDWDKVLRAAFNAKNIIRSKRGVSIFVKQWVEEVSSDDEIINELISCSLAESPRSSREMFAVDSNNTDKNRTIRMVHDLSKKLEKQNEARLVVDYCKSRKDLQKWLILNIENDTILDKLRSFRECISDRDLDIITNFLKGEKLEKERLAEKYDIKPESVYRAERRSIQILKSIVGIRVFAIEEPTGNWQGYSYGESQGRV